MDITKLLDHVQARFEDWLVSFLEERDRRLGDVDLERNRKRLSFSGWVSRRIAVSGELLVRQVTKHIEIYKAVSDEYKSSQMLSTVQIDNFRAQLMATARLAIAELRGHLRRKNEESGDPAPLPLPPDYQMLEGKVLDVVNAKLHVLRTEGALREGTVAQVLRAEGRPVARNQGRQQIEYVRLTEVNSGRSETATSEPVLAPGDESGKVADQQLRNPGPQAEAGAISLPGGRKPPRRKPDLETSRERLALVAKLTRELAAVKQCLSGFCTPEKLKTQHPDFALWNHLSPPEVKEITDGKAFTPKAYAENLTIRHYGLTSRETLKKDRRKLRESRKK